MRAANLPTIRTASNEWPAKLEKIVVHTKPIEIEDLAQPAPPAPRFQCAARSRRRAIRSYEFRHGNRRRSILPLAVNGNASSSNEDGGIM
jgi:hypothetical protein